MIGVVAHDAGGAEVVSSYIRRNKLDCQFCLAGPAVDIFSRKLGEIENKSLENVVAACEWLLCGTSFSAVLEYSAIRMARQYQTKSVAVLDHWVNYRWRFLRNGEWCFPDEIWAGDELSFEQARLDIPEVPTLFVPNAYFQDMREELSLIPRTDQSSGLNILYVCEPFQESAEILYGDDLYWGHTDREVLEYFFSQLEPVANEISSIVLRPHPREALGKYDWVRKVYDLPIVTDEEKSLKEQIVKSDVVAGGGTMAMVVALIADKFVVCSLPPGSKVARLPHEKIYNMVDFVKRLSISRS